MTPACLRRLLPVLCLGLALAGAACSGEKETPQAASTEPTTTEPTAVSGSTSTSPPAPEPPRGIRLRVVSGPGGVFAFVKVYIGRKGPFAFTVDTGASHSVIDFDVVRRLGLKTIGKPVIVTGITCRGEAGRLRMAKWRAGTVRLPGAEIQTIDMPDPGVGIEIDGLLGSDILSTFGAITVDYRAERLLLESVA